MDLGHWKYPGEFNVEDWFGFIYRIVDLNNNKEYLGKKQFFAHTTKAVKGKKNRKHFKKESNWKEYTSSSTHINAAIIERGKDSFVFIIESLHATKGSLHYAEVDAQVTENVLRERFENGDRKYYNGCISGVKFLPPAETTLESNLKLTVVLPIAYADTTGVWLSSLSPAERTTFNMLLQRIPHKSSKLGT